MSGSTLPVSNVKIHTHKKDESGVNKNNIIEVYLISIRSVSMELGQDAPHIIELGDTWSLIDSFAFQSF
jgi:hypothetical protein